MWPLHHYPAGNMTGMVGTALYVSPEVQGNTKATYNQVRFIFFHMYCRYELSLYIRLYMTFVSLCLTGFKGLTDALYFFIMHLQLKNACSQHGLTL